MAHFLAECLEGFLTGSFVITGSSDISACGCGSKINKQILRTFSKAINLVTTGGCLKINEIKVKVIN